MSGGLDRLELVVRDFVAEDISLIDPRRLSSAIDRLQAKLCLVLDAGRRNGDHHLSRLTPTSWAARECGLSRGAAADRLCVGKHLASLPAVAKQLEAGSIGYQAAAAICHLREHLGDKLEVGHVRELVHFAGNCSVENMRRQCRQTIYEVDPDAFDRFTEEDFERRWLNVSSMLDGMYSVDGVLDPKTGSALRDTLDSLAHWRGPEDRRTPGQRRADGLGELLHHHMSEGRLPHKNGVRPHVTLSTSVETLQGLLGAPAAELMDGTILSRKTLERLTCDCTMSRVVFADSQVIDVGRATRTVTPAMRRALNRRDRGCRWPGCDRPVSWSDAHHIEFWARGGPSNLPNLILLCHFHHRLVHEGGWHLVKTGDEVRFIPPAHARGPGTQLAAA